MTNEEAIYGLTKHNAWRMGEPPYDGDLPQPMPVHPIELGQAINVAIKELKHNEHLIKCMESNHDLVMDVMRTGADYIKNLRAGKTYSVDDSWQAIKDKLKETK